MKITVFKNQYGYSTLAKNGEDKMYVSVQFKKGTEPNLEKVRIELKDSFLSLYKNKAGIAFPKFVVMDYSIIEENNSQEPFNNATEVNDPSFDLPF